jgi:hypothetical protein
VRRQLDPVRSRSPNRAARRPPRVPSTRVRVRWKRSGQGDSEKESSRPVLLVSNCRRVDATRRSGDSTSCRTSCKFRSFIHAGARFVTVFLLRLLRAEFLLRVGDSPCEESSCFGTIGR